MSAPARHHNPAPVTLRVVRAGDACATENPTRIPDRADSGLSAVCTRAISRFRPNRHTGDATRAGDVVSLHVQAAKAALATSPMVVEPLSHLDGALRTIAPARAEYGMWLAWPLLTVVGLFRAAVVALATGLVHLVAGEPRPDGTRTRLRAGITLLLVAAAIGSHLALR